MCLVNEQKLMRGLLLDSLDAQKGTIAKERLDRSSQLLRSYLPPFGQGRPPYEEYVALLGDYELMDVARNIIEYAGPTNATLEIHAEPGETVIVDNLAYPGNVVCKGHLQVKNAVVGGSISAEEFTYQDVSVGSHIEAVKINSLEGRPLGALNVPDINQGTVFVNDETMVKPGQNKPNLVFTPPGETFH